jgi:hypothetical protein
MAVLDTLSTLLVRVRNPIFSCTSPEEELFVNIEKALLPQQVLVKNVSADNLGCDTASQVFNSFTNCKLAAVNREQHSAQ